MNPLQYKAHPLLFLTVDLIVNGSAHDWTEYFRLLGIYGVVNLGWAACFRWSVRKVSAMEISWPKCYVLAAFSLLLYIPPILTVISDVLAHAFRLQDRFILILVIVTATQMAAVFHAVVLKRSWARRPIGLEQGLTISLWLLLLAIPYGSFLLGLNRLFAIL